MPDKTEMGVNVAGGDVQGYGQFKPVYPKSGTGYRPSGPAALIVRPLPSDLIVATN